MTLMKAAAASMLTLTLLTGAASAQTDLAQGFQNPPASARPHTWWHWMNGNITREGITADLEAMKEIGLGGAQIFNVSESIPDGPVLYMSPEWRALMKHAVSEADRLGIELCMHNCAGWSSSGGPWITPEHAMQTVVTSETGTTGPSRFSMVLPQPETRAGFYRDIAVLAFPGDRAAGTRIKDIKAKAGYDAQYNIQPALDEYPAETTIRRDGILDITDKLDKDGRLTWDAPPGSWTILRVGYTPTGAVNAPAPVSGRGLECDKLSREGMDAHWAGIMAKIIQDLGPLAGKTLNNCLIDSYEVGHQNWSAHFREEFTKRRGYDPLRMLPVMTGRVVDSGEASERFLWDLRHTISELFSENYYEYFSELCRKNGLKSSIEPYDGPFEGTLVARGADIPMGEFWVGGGESNSCKLASSVAHTYGKTLVGAESFTAEPGVGRWQNDPASLKQVGDLMYTTGINRYIIHRYAHQPWMDRFPGMTMGQWGTHFERTVTWWKQGSAWVSYLTRCQYMLQQGLFAADVLFFAGEATPNGAPSHPELKARGYDYDSCSADVLLHRTTVKNGRLVLTDGMSYRVLVLPDTTFMTPALLTKLHELVEQGATVIGPRPTKSPSLSDYGTGDLTVRKLAGEIWGDCDGKTVKEHVFGNGRVVWGHTPEEVLADLKVSPDCEFAGGAKPKMAWIHRTAPGAEIYFVSSQKARADEVECTFRVADRAPELWHADTGEMEAAPVWSVQGGRTMVPIRFDPAGSVFVVFRKPAAGADHVVSMSGPGDVAPAAAAAPKIEIRKAMYEAVDGAGGVDVTAKVAAMVAAGQTSIPANNASYGDPTDQHVKRLRVEYTLNGKALTRDADENGTLDLVDTPGPDLPPPSWRLAVSAQGALELHAFKAGAYEFKTAAGKTKKADVKSVAAPVEVVGPWTVSFAPNWGAPPSITLGTLISWTEYADAGVKYFSGTAEYEKELEIPKELLGPGKVLWLDLGRVKNLAEVTLNGIKLGEKGVWWKPPFAADISAIAKPGKNALKVRVTNLWVNRLIGDEQYPDDVEWNGKPIKAWPKWFTEHAARPTKERLTFTTWHHWTKNDKPLESGLMGPVVLRPGERVKVE